MIRLIILTFLGIVKIGICHNGWYEDLNLLATHANNEFALDLLKTFPFGRDNQFFSPLSISIALSMTSLGARRNTLGEIKNTLHLNGMQSISSDQMAIHRIFQNLLKKYSEENTDYCLKLANRLFVKNDCEIWPEFVENVETYYNAFVSKIDFNTGRAEDVINEWVEEQTDHKIKGLFAPRSFNSDTLLALVNAVYFKGNWKNKFNEHNTRNLPFYKNRNTEKNVPMMSTIASFPYYEDKDLNVKMIRMPYVGNDLSMVVLLPQQGELPKLISQLDAKKLEALMKKMQPSIINLYFPKLQMERKYHLKRFLRSLDLNDLFTKKADLSGITKESSQVSSIIHQALLDINEKGTVAAAATGYSIRANSMFKFQTIKLIVNRPFFFAIVDKRYDDLILFAGTVISP